MNFLVVKIDRDRFFRYLRDRTPFKLAFVEIEFPGIRTKKKRPALCKEV